MLNMEICMKYKRTASHSGEANAPVALDEDDLALARRAIGQSPLLAVKGLTSDLLSLHAVNLSALTQAIQQPGVLLDEDGVPHKLLLERISFLQRDILAASNALLKLDEALASKDKRNGRKTPNTAIPEGDTPMDVSAIVLELSQTQKTGEYQ